jgi:hypothetical protein
MWPHSVIKTGLIQWAQLSMTLSQLTLLYQSRPSFNAQYNIHTTQQVPELKYRCHSEADLHSPVVACFSASDSVVSLMSVGSVSERGTCNEIWSCPADSLWDMECNVVPLYDSWHDVEWMDTWVVTVVDDRASLWRSSVFVVSMWDSAILQLSCYNIKHRIKLSEIPLW